MKLAAIALVSLVACASNDDSPTTSKQDAKHALVGATSSIGSAQSKQAANLTSAVHVSAPCQSGGTVALDGTADIGPIQKYDLDAAFAACATPDGTLDGALHYAYTLSGTDFTAALTGQLDWTGAQGAVSCAFDLHVAIASASVSVSGTVCGYDLADLDVDVGDLSISVRP